VRTARSAVRAVLAAVLAATFAAAALAAWSLDAPSEAQAPPPSAQSVIDRFASAAAAIDDYQCRLYEWCVKGRNREERVINFYYLRPDSIRMDIVKGNKALDAGSVGVYKGGATVAGRKGGIAAGIVLNVGKRSPLATTVRGQTFDESDLRGILGKMRFHLAESSIAVEEATSSYRLTMVPRDPRRNGGATKEVMVFDASTLLPIYSESYEGETQVQQARWTDYILNAGLPASFFEIRTDGSALGKAGIRSIDGLPIDERRLRERL
jgi:outer membrane lipoprotein-sorting protein